MAGQIAASVSFWAVSWALLILLVLIAAALGRWWWRRRRVAAGPARQAVANASPVREPRRGVLTKRVAVSTALVALAWSVVGVGTPAAMAASSAPYKDPRATSSLALCGKDGQQVTSGSTADRPFVWRAVSSSKAPAPYNKKGRTATLFAYQPRPQVDAGEWSDDPLTASAHYSDAAHPMAAATVLDEPLTTFLDEYPTKLDGFVQLRLYLGAPGQPAFTLQYAAANVQVSCGTWHLVGHPAVVSCTSGTAVSLEAILPTPRSVGHRLPEAPGRPRRLRGFPTRTVADCRAGRARDPKAARTSSVSSASAAAAAGERRPAMLRPRGLAGLRTRATPGGSTTS